jgi:hypothetical protein
LQKYEHDDKEGMFSITVLKGVYFNFNKRKDKHGSVVKTYRTDYIQMGIPNQLAIVLVSLLNRDLPRDVDIPGMVYVAKDDAIYVNASMRDGEGPLRPKWTNETFPEQDEYWGKNIHACNDVISTMPNIYYGSALVEMYASNTVSAGVPINTLLDFVYAIKFKIKGIRVEGLAQVVGPSITPAGTGSW